MVGCLLTTQQRSGPNTPVSRFMLRRPFPLSYEVCQKPKDLALFSRGVLRDFGAPRMSTKISTEIAAHMEYLQAGGWKKISNQLEKVRLNPTPETERTAANFFADNLTGIGPKQSRNLLQRLGLSQWEIPIDSRITKWLNADGFPVNLSAGSLADRDYYNFVMEGFQKLCQACHLSPCVLDAAIYASFDGDGWNDENLVR
jgi:hypothetical protein